MSRFTWNVPSNGRLINRYVDMMCEDFPSIMRQVALKGIKGELTSWFGGTRPAEKATCGCLVGTTCIVAIEKFNHLNQDQKQSHDAALVLYDLVVRKSKRDVSKYAVLTSSADCEDYFETTEPQPDPILTLIYKAGIAASDEAELENRYDIEDGDERDRAMEARHKAVVDHIEHRIRTKLDMPYPKRGRKRDSK
jgi:hypothetical protein